MLQRLERGAEEVEGSIRGSCEGRARGYVSVRAMAVQQPDIHWQGASGNRYAYWIFPIGHTFSAVPGNYIFAKFVGQWFAVYVGQTEDLSVRFDSHHAAACVRQNGATHIHAHTTPGGEQARLDEESDLRRRFRPPCNR